MEKYFKFLFFIISIGFFYSCENIEYQAYEEFEKPSSKGGYDSRNGPFKMSSLSDENYLLSYPYKDHNLTSGDLCTGITKVFDSENNELKYQIEKFFAVNNVHLSNDGESIVYLNNYWKGSSYDSCSTEVLEFYKKGELTKSYSFAELIGEEPEEGEDIHWLFIDYKNEEWRTKNNHYLMGDTLYVATEKTDEIILLDLNTGNILSRVSSKKYLENLSKKKFSSNIIEFIKAEEFEFLPNVNSGSTFREALESHLNVEIIPTDGTEKNGLYYYYFWVDAIIDSNGICLDYKVNTNENVLISEVKELKKKMRDFFSKTKFERGVRAYGLKKWKFRETFRLTKRPKSIARQEVGKYKIKVCQVDTFRNNYVPKDLTDALNQLDILLDEDTKKLIRDKENVHMSVGMWLRNNWGMWGGSRLGCYFGERELYHPDYISSLIIDAYHLKLNDSKFQMDSLIQSYSQMEKEWIEN